VAEEASIICAIPYLAEEILQQFRLYQVQHSNLIDVHDNGNAQIAVYYAKTPYMSFINKTTKQWTVVSVPWWGYGEPEVLWAGDGVFLAKIVGIANIILSFDGITWHNAGYCQGAYNAMTCGTYDINRNVG
jgi:hypothetical protein